jgi:peptide chain release factor subunit 1
LAEGRAWLLRHLKAGRFRITVQSAGFVYHAWGMISHKEIERLASLKSEHGILTAYLRIDPRLRFVRQQATSQFKGALKAAQRRIQGGRWQDALDRESAHVLNFLANREPAGRGMVIFSCRPEGLWETLHFEVSLPTVVDVDTTTKTAILAETLEALPRFIVAVLQRNKARIYIAEQGRSQQQLQIASEVPGQHDQGGWSQMRFQRHIDFHVAEHLKTVADELKTLAAARPFKLALGGTEEIVDEMLKTLSEPIARSVIGRFPVDYKHDSEQQILRGAELLWQKQEQLEKSQLVDQVIDAAKSEIQGVLGVGPTLSALMEEKVRTLLLIDGLAIEGSVCTRCDYFSGDQFTACPLCGANTEWRDVRDRAVEKAILTGAEAEVVSSGEARDRLLAEGGLGALLRY